MQAPRILPSARRCLVKTWSWPWLTRSFTDGLGTLGNLPSKVCGPGLPHAEMSRFWTYSMESPYWAPCKYPIGTRLTGNSDPVPICVPFTPIHRRWLKKNGGYRFVQSIVKKMVNDNVSNYRFTPKYVTYPEELYASNKLLHDLSCFDFTNRLNFSIVWDL